MRASLESAVVQLDGLIAVNMTTNKAYADLQSLSDRAKTALRDWGNVNSRCRGSGGMMEKYKFVMFHPTLGIMCLTAAVIDGAAAVAAGKVRRGLQGELQELAFFPLVSLVPRPPLPPCTPLNTGSIPGQSPD